MQFQSLIGILVDFKQINNVVPSGAAAVSIPNRDFSGFQGGILQGCICAFGLFQSLIGILVDFK